MEYPPPGQHGDGKMNNGTAKKKAEMYITLANLIAATRTEIRREDYPSHVAWMAALHKSAKLGDVSDE